MGGAIKRQKRRVTAREGAKLINRSPRTVQRLVAQPREEWLQEQRERREAIRVFHDDDNHTWPETGHHFGISHDTARRLGHRARKERAAEELARIQPPLPFEETL